jgi:hypothetical protein
MTDTSVDPLCRLQHFCRLGGFVKPPRRHRRAAGSGWFRKIDRDVRTGIFSDIFVDSEFDQLNGSSQFD